jgi:hypothetical protein
MSDESMTRARTRSSSVSVPGSGRALIMPIFVLSAGLWVLALSETSQSWEMSRLASSYEAPARIGDLVSATLANGQVFFGTLDAATRTTIRLRDVFFAQLPAQTSTTTDQDTSGRAPVIVRRKDNEWTQADVMSIPIEKVSYMETVGTDSRMARFIADARSHPPSMPSDLPAGQIPGGNTAPSQASPPPTQPKG